MKKRLLSLTLAFVMVLGMLPVQAFAAAVELPVSGGRVDITDAAAGPYTLQYLDIYEQGSYAAVSIVSATQDGSTIDIVLAAETDPSAALQAGLSGGGQGSLSHSGNKCTLSGGTGTMTYSFTVRMGPQLVASGSYTINFSIPMGEACTVTAPSGEGFTFTGKDSAYKDSAYSFQIAVNEGYDGSNMVVKVNGDPVEGDNGTYTVASVPGELVITVEGVVAKEVCNITTPVGEGFTFTGAETVYKGESYTFKIAVDNAYDASNMAVKAGETELTGNNGTYTIEAVDEDTVISVTGIVKKTAYTVTMTEGTGYTISGQNTSYAGEPYTFTVTVDDAVYKASEIVVKVNGEPVTLTDGKYTIEALDGDKAITVENVVERQLFTVNKPEVEGVTFTGRDDVREGKPYTFSIAVDNKYISTDMVVRVNDAEVELTNGNYTIESASENIEISIEGVVKKKEYTVTKPSVEGVTVTGADTVLETDPYTFTVTVSEIYDISNMVVMVNDEPVALTNGSYTIPSVAADVTITVSGLTKKDVCVVEKPTGNKFTFEGADFAYKGSDYAFTVMPQLGYEATVTVNGEVITGTTNQYAVKADGETLTIVVTTERVNLPDKELTVTDNGGSYTAGVTSNQITTTLTNSFFATITGIKVTGAVVNEAFEDGRTVYFMLDKDTPDTAAVDIEFLHTTSNKNVKLVQSKWSLALVDGEGGLKTAVTVRYSSSNRYDKTSEYTLIFFREIPAEEPPARIVESATAEVWKGWPLEIKLNTYFTDADTHYLVDGETKTQIEGNVYTFVSPVAGEQTLVFLAENEIGFSEPVTVTVTVKDVESGIYINHSSGNGSLDSVQFCNADGEPIDGIEISYDRPTRVITVVLPKDYEVNGTVKTKFQLTQNASGYPYVSQVTETVANRPYAARFTEKSIQLTNGAAEFVFYYYNKDTGAVDAGGQTKFSISIKIKNDRPELAEGVEAAVAATVTAGQEYELDLSPIFTDIDNDTLTYQYKVGDGDWQDCGTSFTYSNIVAADYILTFRAFDTKDYSTEYYTVTLTVENVKDTYDMTVSVPAGLEPKFYVSTGFKDGVDTQGASLSAVAGETADGMTAYTVSYPQNAEMLSVRTENWGGMAFPAEENGTVTLRQVKLSVVDYEEIPAESTNTVTYDGNTAVAGTEGWLLVTGQEYTYTAVPKDAATLATVTERETLEAGADVYVREMMLNIKNPITITVPTGAKAQLYNINTNKYYVASELDAKIVKDNGDGTTTYFFVGDTKASGACFVYRVSMDGKITKVGYMAWGKQSATVTYTDADKADTYRLDDYSSTGYANSGMTEDSVLLNVNSRNHLRLSVGETTTLKAYRAWEIIKISYQNYILTPDFTYTILSGEDVVSLTEKASPSTAAGDWMTLTALKEGVAVIEVTYDALEVTGGSYDGIYGASDPARTGIVVVQVGGSDDASVDFGIDCFASIGKSGSSNISYNPGSKKAWDAEFDTLYFTEDSGELNLTPTADSAIAEVAVSHDKGATWKPLSDTDGVYTAEIVPGNNILRVTTASGTAYQVVRGDKVSVTFKEVDGSSDGDGVVEAGETIRVSLIGLHTPIPKMAGNYNPGFGSNNDGYSSHHLNYTANGEAIYGSGAQYNFITAANYVDIVMPADGSSVSLTDGYIGVGVIGLKNFVNGGDSHRNIPDTGCSTRGSDTTFHTRSILPEITVSAGGTSVPNSAPVVRADAVTEGEIYADQKFAINPDTLFLDSDGDTLTFTVSVNGGTPAEAEVSYKFEPAQAGVYTLTFTADDGEETARHTVTVTVKTREQEGGQNDNFGLEESEIAGYVTVSFEDNAVRVTGETGLKFPVPLGTIVEPTRVPFKANENVAQATKRLLDHLNIGMSYSGTLESGFYLGAITDFEVDSTPYDSMGEFDAGVGSGWMITQNGVFINKGAAEFKVADGDILKWQYTCQLGADIGDDYAAKRIENVEKLISEIGEVTLDKADEISAARAAYDELTEVQKQQVKNYSTLTDAEKALDELKDATAADQAAADAVEALIAAIGKVDPEKEDEITAARTAYDALTDTQKLLVENYETLTDAEGALEALKSFDLDRMYETTAEALLGKTPSTGSIGGEWLVFGLARATDKDLTDAQKAAYEAAVKAYIDENINSAGQLHKHKPTENERIALALTALGYDPTSYNGKNLLSALENTTWATKQGNNGTAFALQVFNAAGYSASNEDALIRSLLDNQLSSGGWNINSGSADADTTAMVVQALAPYYTTNEAVKSAVDKALAYLKNLMNAKGQLDNGTDEPSVETVSQTIVALCELGIDPASWKTERGITLLHGLASFYAGNGFGHVENDGYDQMSTEQAFYTMVAYKRFLDANATSLYDMSDLKDLHTVEILPCENGSVTVSKSSAMTGETITVTVAPDLGYQISKLTMNDAELTITDNRATFTMPDETAILEATFVKAEASAQAVAQAMTDLEVKDAEEETYDAIADIKKAYSKLTAAEKLEIADEYRAFQNKVKQFETYLKAHIDDAVDELEYFFDDLDEDDYSKQAWKKIEDLYEEALEAVKAARFEEEVYELLEEYLEDLEEAAAGELEVTFRLIGDWKHDDGVSGHDEYVTWIETTEYNMPAGSTIYDLFIKAIDDFDLNEKGASKNYVESIQAPDILGGYWIGEFDNGPNSGWMYTINGYHPGYGLKEQDLEDGDEVIWHYVDDYTLEERKPSSKYYERWLEADDISPETWVKRNLDKIITVEGKGEVKPELKTSHIGKDVKFTFTPAEGWVIKTVYVDGKNMGAIETYTYKDLAMDARIEVVFAQNVPFQMNFVDVPEAEWFYDDVYFAVSNGLFNGIDEVTFAPGASMTRAMLVTVLYRLEGQPTVYGGSAFADVAADQWYTDAVIWATRNGIVNGYDNGKFGTGDNVTREQMATILYRYAQNCGYDTTARADLKGYTDADKISSYAQEAMSWANAMGLINGRTYNTLAPTGTATRAEVAAIFHRFVENIVK